LVRIGENKTDLIILMIIMPYHIVLSLYSYSCCYGLEYPYIDMLMTCILVYSVCVMSISYMSGIRLISVFDMCRLVYSLHVFHILR
jgi:hypothetical protein